MIHSPVWRPMRPEDLPAVMEIAALVHPNFPEDIAVFAERHRLYPAGAHLLHWNETACGYLVSHPWHSGPPPALNSLLHRLPPSADTFYLHDLALLPAGRGTGAARTIVNSMMKHAREGGFSSMRLMAVNGSVPFWERFGFVVEDDLGAADHGRSYGEDARMMARPLDPCQATGGFART